MSDSLWPHALWHARLLCPSLSPRVCSHSCPLSRWCYLTISSSVTPFSFCLWVLPASGCFPVSLLFVLGDQSFGSSALALVLPMNIQGWFPLGFAGLISLQSKGLSRVFSSATVQKHQFFSTQPSLWSYIEQVVEIGFKLWSKLLKPSVARLCSVTDSQFCIICSLELPSLPF